MMGIQSFLKDLFSVRDTHGPESILGLISPDMTNEAAYLFQKFFRILLGSNNIMSVFGPELPWTPLSVLKDMMGVFNISPRLEFLEHTDMIIIVDVSASHTSTQRDVLHKFQELKEKQFILFSSGRSLFEDIADIRFKLCPEALAELLRAVLWELHYHGSTDREILWKDSLGFQTLLQGLRTYRSNFFSRRWGISEKKIRKTILEISHQRRISMFFCDNGWPDFQIARCCKDALNLLMATGHIGGTGKGFYYIPSHRNVIGVALMGCNPQRFPGYLPLQDEGALKWLDSSWNHSIPRSPGVTINGLMDNIESGKIKALLLLGTRLKDIFPGNPHFIRALSGIELLAGAATLLDPHAQYWWPLVSPQFRTGSVIRFDRKLIHLRPDVSDSASQCFQDWEIPAAWLKEYNKTEQFETEVQILSEIRTVVPGLISMNLNENPDEDVYFLSVAPESTGILEQNFDVDDIPEFHFQPVPEPTPMEHDGIIGIIFRQDHEETIPVSIKKWMDGAVPVAVMSPEDAQNYNIEKNCLMTFHVNSEKILMRCLVGTETTRRCITAWIPRSCEFSPPLPDKEDFLRIRALELKSIV